MPQNKAMNAQNEISKEKNSQHERVVVEKFDSYIKKIIKNEIIDYKRKKARLYSQELSFDEVDSEQIARIEGYSD